MGSYIIVVVYLCPIISCLKGFALFYHIPHRYAMHMSLEVLRKVRENSRNVSTFLFLLEKPNYKNPRSFLYRFEHAKFVLIIK